MALLYDARIGFDFNAHWPHIQYIATRHALPPLDFNTTAPHPPLYHLIAAVVVGRGLDAGALGWMAALWGMLRLGLVWVGLEKWLPESRMARVVALALAAVLPAAAHLDGMITNETLVMLMSAAVFVVAPSAIAGADRPDGSDAGVGRAARAGADEQGVGVGADRRRRRRDRSRDRPHPAAVGMGTGAARAGAAAHRRRAGLCRRRGAVVRAQRGPLRNGGAQRP